VGKCIEHCSISISKKGGPVSRVLYAKGVYRASRMVAISLDTPLLMCSSGLPAILSRTRAAWTGSPSLFDLARDEVCQAISIAENAVSSYLAFSPLPHARRYVFCGTLCPEKTLLPAKSRKLHPFQPGHYPASSPSEPGLSSGFRPAATRPA